MVRSWVRSLIDSRRSRGEERPVVERRGAPRFEARNSRAMLGWGEGDGLVIEPIKVVDISRSGLLVVADSVPPEGVPIRLRFEDRRVAWIEAATVRIGRNPGGPHWIRAAFLEPCPDDVLASVIGADTSAGAAPGAPPSPDLRAALSLLGLAWPCDQAEAQAAFRRRSEAVGAGLEGALALREAFEAVLMACHSGQLDANGATA